MTIEQLNARLQNFCDCWLDEKDREVVTEWSDPDTGFLATARDCLSAVLADQQRPSSTDADTAAASSAANSPADSLTQLCNELAVDIQALTSAPPETTGSPPSEPIAFRLPGCRDVFLRETHKQWLRQLGERWRKFVGLNSPLSGRRQAVTEWLIVEFDTANDPHADETMARFALLAACHAYSARAAWRLAATVWQEGAALPDGFADDLRTAMQCCFSIWPLLTGGISTDAVNQTTDYGRAAAAVQQLLAGCASSDPLRTFPSSAWLAVVHLLRNLLSEDSRTVAPASGNVQIQLVDELVDDVDKAGVSTPLKIRAFRDRQTGCGVNLVSAGLILPDPDMLESLNIAWELGENRVQDTVNDSDGAAAPNAVMLSFTLPDECRLLIGDSAGGMAATALYAVACGKQPDSSVTGSFTIQRIDDSRRASQPNNIRITSVRESAAKVRSAQAAGCRHYAISQDDEIFLQQSGRRKFPETLQQISIRPFVLEHNGFADAVRLLTTNATLIEILSPLNRRIVDAWTTGPLRSVSGPAAGGKADFLRQPSPYIEPHLGELKRDQQQQDRSAELDQSGDRTKNLDRNVSYEWLTDDESVRETLTEVNEQTVAEAEFREMLRRSIPRPPADVEEDTEQAERSPLLPCRILIAEDANAGKTVFSKRLAAFLAAGKADDLLFGGEPPLVLRWEKGPEDKSSGWPNSVEAIRQAILSGLQEDGSASAAEAETYLQALLRQQRIFLIFDSADQAGDEAVKQVIAGLVRDKHLDSCHVLVTGRSYSFQTEAVRDIFEDSRWYRFTILPFTKQQQQNYLRRRGEFNGELVRGPMPTSQVVETVFEDYPAIQELLGVAGMLEMVRRILLTEFPPPRADLSSEPAVEITMQRLKTRCDFYCYYLETVLKSAALKAELKYEQNSDRWWLLLSTVAFRMMLARAVNYSAPANYRRFKEDVEAYCNRWLTSHRVPQQPISPTDWDEVKAFSVMTNHGIIEGREGESLSFRHKGWLEFFGAMFLARFADPEFLPAMQPEQIRFTNLSEDQERRPGFTGVVQKECIDANTGQTDPERLFDHVLCQLTNAEEWYWCWRLAAEMPRYGSQSGSGELANDFIEPARLGRSLRCLLLQPVREIRPNELAWRAFYLFEQDEWTEPPLRAFEELIPPETRNAALAALRDPAASLLKEIQTNTAAWEHAARGGPDSPAWRDWLAQDSRTKSLTFLPCPPQPDTNCQDIGPVGIHHIGENGLSDEEPPHRVALPPFYAQATPVTRGIYHRFDEHFSDSQTNTWWGTIESDLQRLASPAPDDGQTNSDNYPVVAITWYDSFMLAKFLGPEFTIPTECRHEALIRGGSSDSYCFGEDPNGTRLQNFAWFAANSGGRTHQVAELQPNRYGLFDVHGNVLEWSFDWYESNRYEQQTNRQAIATMDADDAPVFTELPLSASGSSRVLRGSSFNYDRGDARAACRVSNSPGFRHFYYGCRLVWLRGLRLQSSSDSDKSDL